VSELFDMTGKVAIVTGGGRGLGKAISLGLAGAGADVVVASRKLPACREVAQQIEALGRQSLAVTCDISQWNDLDSLVEETYQRFGRCDALVNNAGVTQGPLPLTETSSEFFDQLYGVNVKGPMRLASLLAPRMGESGGGTIVNVITIGAIKPGGYLGMYCSSKAAMHALTRVMAEEWAPLGVRVNAIAPGPFQTDMMDDLEKNTPGFTELSANSTVLKRVADPGEIVGAVLYLASDASSFVTAETLSVAGGFPSLV
jgi:NAD(P)-dependent dehydrogenase (short-subunit alcohol dehydrogenase family)